LQANGNGRVKFWIYFAIIVYEVTTNYCVLYR
jgi:hypothetical protein